jgi:formylglycine-generating enzyme required for sulfatase activity
MSWPTPTQYFEAVQNLRSSVGDEELIEGRPACNVQGMPMLWSGHFADVYKIECPATGNIWALKCFTREVAGLRDRYRDISVHLKQAKLPFTVRFQYLESGIRIAGRWFPALKMRWIEGLSLNQFVENHVNRPKTLGQLLVLWPKLAKRLREAGVAHADLQHGNVLLVPMHRGQLALKLIDYDGMFIPSLADRPSGELGHPAYQHPQRLREGTYSFEVDRFSHLAVYCAVRCLKVGRQGLWDRFNNDDNLLFREADFRNPGKSELFQLLWGLPDRDARALVGRLALACGMPIDQVPLLNEVLVKGDGKVIPMTQQQEAEAKKILEPRSRVSLALPAPQEETAVEAIIVAEVLVEEKADEKAGIETQAREDVLPADAFFPPEAKDEQQIVDWMMEGAEPGGEGERPILAELVEEPELREFVMPSLGSLLLRLICFLLRRFIVAPVRATDRFLRTLVGEENTILHNFLRFLAIVILVSGVVFGFGALIENQDRQLVLKRNAPTQAGIVHLPATIEQDILKRGTPFLQGSLDLGGGVKIEFVCIPPGRFLMGDVKLSADERPVHLVSITKPFWIGKCEVTQSQWVKVMGANPSAFEDSDNPVDSVSWDDCQRFLARLNEKHAALGMKFDLPTEAQWEYACRAGGFAKFCFGDDDSRLGDYAWFDLNSGSQTHSVGMKKPNAWGLFDMHGNVWEWCSDHYDQAYYQYSSLTDPAGPVHGTHHVLRGGSWVSDKSLCRSTQRNGCPPKTRESRNGFRLVCEK